MRKLILALVLLPIAAWGQVTGSIPSAGGGASCVTIGVGSKGSTVAITITGTWTGTLQPEVSVQGQTAANVQVTPSTSSTAASTITANGTYFTVGVAGADTFLLCGNTVASGTANVYLNISTAGSAAKGGGGGGTGTVTHTGNLTSGQVVIGNGTADAKVDTACSTNGAGVMTCVTLGTSGSNGGLSGVEGTGAGLTAGAGTDLFWPDSTAHRWKMNNNNGSAVTVASTSDPTPVPTPGTSVTLAAPRGYAICTGTCTVSVPVPAAGYEFCILNDDNVATAITLSALGSSAMYENTARTGYGAAGTGTFTATAAAGNKVCLVGRDATHYLTVSFIGTWTAN